MFRLLFIAIWERRAFRRVAVLVCALALAMCWPAGASGLSPDSPEVKQMIERGLKFLETFDDERLGARCLSGLSFYKSGRTLSHPRIYGTQQACQAAMSGNVRDLENYSVGLAIIFLLETNPEANRRLAQQYVAELLRRQQRAGGWGYEGHPQGDTSQTQYPTLALWLAINNGIDVPLSAIERDCGWLLRTQDPSGAWGYHGVDPGHYQRVPQSEIRPALVAAGLGSLYICADLLGLHQAKPEREEATVPAALRPLGDPLVTKRSSGSIDPMIIRKALIDGNYWFTKNYRLDSEGHTHYYLYAYERYQSFREFVEKRSDSTPRWYNDIAAELRKTQSPDGSWQSGDGQGVATSFAVLTLLRSAKKTLAAVVPKLGDGVLVGGMGLPKKTADLQERDGKVIEELLAGTIEELVTTIEKATPPELERLAESPARWKLDSDVLKRSGEIVKLKSLVGSGAYEARLATVRALARVRELDNVPLLIFAMSDADVRIAREADKGLRFISRKFDGVGLSEEPKAGEVKGAIAAWRGWYLSIRPAAELLD
jgi:hypothetical protein